MSRKPQPARRDSKKKTVPRNYEINNKHIFAFIGTYLVITYVYACLRTLGIAGLFDVLSALGTGLSMIYILISALAVYYIADIIRRRIKKLPKAEIGADAKVFLRAAVCVFIAFLLEITVLQYNHYGTIWAGEPVDINEWDDVNGTMTVGQTDSFTNPVTFYYGDTSSGEAPVISFDNLDRRVASVHIEPYYDVYSNYSAKTMTCYVVYNDEESTGRNTVEYTIVKGLKHTEYIPVYSIGKVNRITVVFTSGYTGVLNVTLNEIIPLTPVFLRILLISLLLFIVGILRRYNIFALKFDADSKLQNYCFAALMTLFAAYCAFVSFAGYTSDINDYGQLGSETYRWENQYNYLADALVHGRLNIDVGFDGGELFDLDRMYDMTARMNSGVEHPHDTVAYNGKFYVYFGVVPCVLLYLPYNLITGRDLPNWFASFFFCSASLIFLSLTWREAVKRLFPKISYVLFMLGAFALSFCSFAPFIAVRSAQYDVAVLSGLALTAFGLYMLLKFAFSVKKRLSVLVFACLGFALAVGCRPTMVLWSVFVPILIWSEIKAKPTRVKTLIAVFAPYIIVAIPLMLYNYARFGSITEFGNKYMLTNINLSVRLSNMTPVEYFYCWINGSIDGLYFKPPVVMSRFPYIRSEVITTGSNGILLIFDSGVFGILSVPVVWFMMKIRSASAIIREKNAAFIKAFIAGIAVFAVTSFVSPLLGGVVVRYSVDFFWFAVLSSLIVICALLYKHADSAVGGITEKLAVTAMLASGLMGLCSSFLGEAERIMGVSPNVYYYLQRALTFFAGT